MLLARVQRGWRRNFIHWSEALASIPLTLGPGLAISHPSPDRHSRSFGKGEELDDRKRKDPKSNPRGIDRRLFLSRHPSNTRYLTLYCPILASACRRDLRVSPRTL